ncbi:DUF4145 domain-containing protein [Streptomyces coeruleorubidus]|uniref:DUF4145 domain-containing protein n=1 Tax=Streptomyces coeruleorubidus TaxID=116188 RepID=UPI0037935499
MASTTCGWCGRLAHMRPVGGAEVVPDQDSHLNVGFEAYRCANCRRLVLAYGWTDFKRTNDWDDAPSDLWDHPQAQQPRWLPPAKSNRTFPDVPVAIESLAVEAHDCLSIKADRAAVALARAVVEASAKEKGVTRGSLIAKIDELHQLGLLRGHIKEAAHEVRFGGNEVAHGDLTPVDHEAAEEILTLMDEVLNDLFQSPARVARARQRRLERSQAGPASVNTTASEGQPGT